MDLIYAYSKEFFLALLSSSILFPAFLIMSKHVGLLDKPNERKLHVSPIPVIGGLVVMLSLIFTFIFSKGLQTLVLENQALAFSLVILAITGVVDDKIGLKPALRFGIQAFVAFAIAADGIRLQSLNGLFGIHELSLFWQYALTMFITIGITNAFNLIDGINGLAGSLGLVNMIVLSGMAFLLNQTKWLFILIPIIAAFIVFLRFNWKKARLFMGDGGSLVLGFSVAAISISLIKVSDSFVPDKTASSIAIVTAICMIPVIDTLRVFYQRMSRGKSPFSADKNHLHHLLVRHHLTHAQAATRLLLLHIFLFIFSILMIKITGLFLVIVGQVLIVVGYTWGIQLFTGFVKSYLFIRRLENAGNME